MPSGLSNVVAVAGGANHSLVLKADGTVVAWGFGIPGLAYVPPDLSNVVAIAAGAGYSVALKDDRTAVRWGADSSPELNVPTSLSDVVAIASGANHILALKADETVVVWGFNYFGQTNVPPGITGVGTVVCGVNHNLAIGDNTPPLADPLTVQGVGPGDIIIKLSAADPNGDLGERLAEGASLQGRPEQHDDQETQTSSAHSSITSETRAEINPKPQYHFGLLQTGIGNSTLLRDSSRRLPPHWTL